MIISFKNQATEDIFNGVSSRVARNTCPQQIWRVAIRKLDLLDSVLSIEELLIPPANRLERLSGNRARQHSIRVNGQYRICFIWTERGPEDVEIVDYH